MVVAKLLEKVLQVLSSVDRAKSASLPKRSKAVAARSLKKVSIKKSFVSSVRSGRHISSERADQILVNVQQQNGYVVKRAAEINGKRSLAWMMWALHAAESVKIQDGLSVHDMSALLYKAADIEIYPINLSRMLHDHQDYIQQTSQNKRTKRYLLTEAGHQAFGKFLEQQSSTRSL